MRLIDPAPGEILDRLTILDLKISVGGKQKKVTAHFEAEKEQLLTRMEEWNRLLQMNLKSNPDALREAREVVAQGTNGLMAINALLWSAEDDVRATGENEAFKLARLAKQIHRLNDDRSNTVNKISQQYSFGQVMPHEKLYNTTER